MAFKLDHIVY